MPDLDTTSRALILDYLDGTVPLDVVRRRFMRLAWRLDSEVSVATNPVTARTSLWLAEYGAGHRSEGDLRELLADILRSVAISFEPPLVLTGATPVATQPVRSPQFAVVGRQAVGGYA